MILMMLTLSVFSQEFICGTPYVDIRDGQVYPTVKIGNKCFMAKNLNYGTKVNYPEPQTIILGQPKKWCYGNNEANCDVYGAFYQWDILMHGSRFDGAQGVCPSGWHIVTFDELLVVIAENGGTVLAGARINEAGYTHWMAPPFSNYYGTTATWQKPIAWKPTNATGFTMVGSGMIGGWAAVGKDLKKTGSLYTSTMKRTIDLPGYAEQPSDSTFYPVKLITKWNVPTTTLMSSFEVDANPTRCVKD
jgi:uncharacterized protein (TIGR02145 family)